MNTQEDTGLVTDNPWEEDDDLVLRLTHGEASALCYFIAFAALHHTQGDRKLTPHEDAMVTKVAQMDATSYEMWRESVMRAAGGRLES